MKEKQYNNRVRIHPTTLQLLKEHGFPTSNISDISKSVHEILHNYLGEIANTDVKVSTLKSLKASVNSKSNMLKMYDQNIPDELKVYSDRLVSGDKLDEDLNQLCESAHNQCPNLLKYLFRICFGRNYKSNLEKLSKDDRKRKMNMLGVVVHLLCNCSNTHSTKLSICVGAILVSAGVSDRTIDNLCKMGLTASRKTVTRHLDKHIKSRLSMLKKERSLIMTYDDNLEFRCDVKYVIGEKVNSLIHTITSLVVVAPCCNVPDIGKLNREVNIFSMDKYLPLVLERADVTHSSLLHRFLLDDCFKIISGLATDETTTFRKEYFQFDCFPSFMGNGSSNEHKTQFFESFRSSLNCQRVSNGDQVFASFLHRAHMNGKLMDVWANSGDWHFHYNDLIILMKHGASVFNDLTILLNSKAKDDCKNYNYMFGFIKVFTTGVGVWLMRLFLKEYGIKYSELNSFYLKMRSKSRTLGVLLHLFELGVDNISFQAAMRRNDASTMRDLYGTRLQLFAAEDRPNYLHLTAFQIKQWKYLSLYCPSFLQFLDTNRGVTLTGNNYLGNDEFTEYVHSDIKESRIAMNVNTMPKSIQRTVYSKQLERKLKACSYSHTKYDSLQEDIDNMVNILFHRLGESVEDLDKFIIRNPISKTKLLSVFNPNNILGVVNRDPLDKYNGYSREKLIENLLIIYNTIPTDPTIISDVVVEDVHLVV